MEIMRGGQIKAQLNPLATELGTVIWLVREVEWDVICTNNNLARPIGVPVAQHTAVQGFRGDHFAGGGAPQAQPVVPTDFVAPLHGDITCLQDEVKRVDVRSSSNSVTFRETFLRSKKTSKISLPGTSVKLLDRVLWCFIASFQALSLFQI